MEFRTKDWYDGYIEEPRDMNYYVVSDWHLNHDNIKTYCQRPNNFTELIVKRHNQTVRPEDVVFMLGDVCIGKKANAIELIRSMNGRKILVRGNHDRDKSCGWWMENGFDFACDGFKFRQVWFTHEPAKELPEGAAVNVHGHLHNIWDGFEFHGDNPHEGTNAVINVLTGKPFEKATKLHNVWQRLFAIEYTDYYPVPLDKFLTKPEKYQAIGPKEEANDTKTSA